MRKIILDKKGICEYQKNRDPYLMIDYASEIIPGKSAKGYKDLKDDEWFFTVHWKNDTQDALLFLNCSNLIFLFRLLFLS